MSDESEREHCANLVAAMIEQPPWKDQPWARCALATAAAAIRRGRHLTDREKLLNLARAMEETDANFPDLAAKMRQAAGGYNQ